jgi:acyl-CoA synthetase (AMP-forming)/AMP-acid ligase II/acyl carrier protein
VVHKKTIVEILKDRVHSRGEDVAYVFLTDLDNPQKVTYAQLHSQSELISQEIKKSAAQGDRVLIVLKEGFDYVKAFYGCLYSRVIAVPSYPPVNERQSDRLKTVAMDSGATTVITTTSLFRKISEYFNDDELIAKLEWIFLDEIDENKTENLPCSGLPEISDTAFLQYTSGSTGNPKGVIVSHKNLIHNLNGISYKFETTKDSVAVIWLPPYHDMGLVGGILQPAYCGYLCVLMPPAMFLRRPYTWLKAISDYKGSVSGGPDFSYELCNREISEEILGDLDLHSWEVAFSGAEPVKNRTLEAFYKKFSKQGFKRNSFYPCYGLAEASLFVSGGKKSELPEINRIDKSGLESGIARQTRTTLHEIQETSDQKTIVSCGTSLVDQETIIVDNERMMELDEGLIGEIWIKGDSVAGGYWGKKELSKAVFDNFLKNESYGPFLKTGDLGYLNKGELYITGRIKDLIIIRGRNIYPQDVEETVLNLVRPAKHEACAVFSTDANQSEGFVVVIEISKKTATANLEELAKSVRDDVTNTYGVTPDEIAFVLRGQISRTTSGKIQRQETRNKYFNNNIKVKYRLSKKGVTSEPANSMSPGQSTEIIASKFIDLPKNERENLFLEIVKKRISKETNLDLKDIDQRMSVTNMGIDSIQIAKIASRLEADLGITISLDQFFEDITLSNITIRILDEWENNNLALKLTTEDNSMDNNESNTREIVL